MKIHITYVPGQHSHQGDQTTTSGALLSGTDIVTAKFTVEYLHRPSTLKARWLDAVYISISWTDSLCP